MVPKQALLTPISPTVTKHPGPRRHTRWPSSPQTAQARCPCHHVLRRWAWKYAQCPFIGRSCSWEILWFKRVFTDGPMDIPGMWRLMEGVWRSKLQVMDAVITLLRQRSHASRRICLGVSCDFWSWRRWMDENDRKINENMIPIPPN